MVEVVQGTVAETSGPEAEVLTEDQVEVLILPPTTWVSPHVLFLSKANNKGLAGILGCS